MVDFKKKIALKSKSKITNPIELYNTLDRKSIAGPLRPVQEYALDCDIEEIVECIKFDS